jgi:hypothetical protein
MLASLALDIAELSTVHVAPDPDTVMSLLSPSPTVAEAVAFTCPGVDVSQVTEVVLVNTRSLVSAELDPVVT